MKVGSDMGRIDHMSIGEPITVSGRTIRAVARVKGRRFSGGGGDGDRAPGPGSRDRDGDQSAAPWSRDGDDDRAPGPGDSRRATERREGAAGGEGAFVRLTPLEFIVRDADGTRYRVPVTDPMREIGRGMLQGALGIAVVCWLVIRIVSWLRTG